MRHWPRISFACLLAFMLVTFVGRTAGAARMSTSHPLTCGSWTAVPSPSPFTEVNYLIGVSAVSPNDVWAVGTGQSGSGPQSTLVEHWDGTNWSAVSSPNPAGGQYNSLYAVSGDATNDVWAVGYYNTGNARALIEHWNGTNWSIVPSPQLADAFLEGVVALSANNAWAVGSSYGAHSSYQALIEHWDGAHWSMVVHTHPGKYVVSSLLNGITAISRGDIWAVGSATRSTSTGEDSGTFTEHWDGSSWHGVFSPKSSRPYNYLSGVAGTSTGDVWAVGQADTQQQYQPLAEHWDGARWRTVPTQQLQNPYTVFGGVAALSSNDAWAVGTLNVNHSNPQTLIENWNGKSWTVVPSPNPQPYDELFEVAASPDHSVWAVGYDSAGNYPSGPLIEYYC